METITKENSIALLTNSIHLAQKGGCFLLSEAATLKKAVDFFNPDPKVTKSDFNKAKNPELVAVSLLLQGAQKAQAHKNCPWDLNDASLLWDVVEFWAKSDGAVTNPEKIEDEGEEDDAKITLTKGKSRRE